MRLALVVPALNEEEAIAGTLRRALASREKVCAETQIDEMIIVFVNDGSTDRTQEIVDQPEFNDVVKVHFKHNRGYGAAIKAGWQATDADLVGFIDGDGTCDPDFTVKLANRLTETEADVVLAGRLNPESEMPLIRKIGNIIFARLLGLVSGKDLTDSASGFRIVRRTSLRLMSPLPDGLHFTPAMSCICLLDPRLRIEEVPMPYKERLGRSKLSVVKDGLRFLWTILFSACVYAPIKTMLGTAVITATGASILAAMANALVGPSVAWAIAATTCVTVLMLLATGIVTHQLNFILIGPRRHVGAFERMLQAVINYKVLILGGAIVSTAGLAALAITNSEEAAPMPLLLSSLATVIGIMAGLGGVILRVIWSVNEKHKALISDEFAAKLPTSTGQQTSDAASPASLEGAAP